MSQSIVLGLLRSPRKNSLGFPSSASSSPPACTKYALSYLPSYSSIISVSKPSSLRLHELHDLPPFPDLCSARE